MTASDSTAPTEDRRCFHCGLPVPRDASYEVEIDGVPRPMCCPGCRAVAQAIVDGGLEDYYRHRTALPEGRSEPLPEILDELRLYDRPEVQRTFVHAGEGEVRDASLILEGITCAACVWLSERHVGELPGVLEFRVNYATHRARVKWDASSIRLSRILEAIAAIGYRAHPFDPERQEMLQKRERAQMLKRLAVAGLGMMQVMMVALGLYIGHGQGMQADIQARFGVSISMAESLLEKRVSDVEKRLMPTNHTRTVDAARLLGIPFMNLHTPSDNMVASYLQKTFDEQKPYSVGDILDILRQIPEYRQAAGNGAGPKVIQGSTKHKAGKVFVDMTGGTEGPKEIFAGIAQSGINTVVG
ncbi:MAG: heavy metal translocating P-type ATPase metal-binding domain-containing protein, partial [Acidihalobacter sp.]